MLRQLEQVEGSGLFLVACILEHNCDPSCRLETPSWASASPRVVSGKIQELSSRTRDMQCPMFPLERWQVVMLGSER